jgi:peptidoglycan/xylan/chitin deacetylase (PgdA/CDA1 family)
MRAISIGYHDVVENGDAAKELFRRCPLRYTLDRSSFRDHLKSIRQMAPQAHIDKIDRYRIWKTQIPIFLTFDDGALGSYTCIAEDLERWNWRGHFFIITNYIGRPGFVDRRQIRELRERGHVIGSHTCSHPAQMSQLRWDELRAEWSHSCAVLSEILGEQVRVASVANGYYSRTVGRAAAASGIEVLFNSEPTTAISAVDGCLVMGRYSIKADTSPAVSGAVAAGWTWPRWRQTAVWETKKAGKALAGDHYLTVRNFLTSRGASK